MIIIIGKTVKQSEINLRNLMEPIHSNIAGNVHGGEIMKLMDNAAGVVAARHSGRNVVTARVDKVEFHYPIHISNLVTFNAKLSFVGNSSMEVFVKVLVEDFAKEDSAKVAATAFFTMVALDENGKPAAVPPLEITNDEERRLFEEGRERYLNNKKK
ncbi:Cytosolic acyl coenzyme A thioester hydrolase [Proteiniborus sp. DW1]|uniref:acyl-CoA thioesterase n=1 Tax=Proteiniborus sp. DW1 TaxID=1889883 RepID=UPI00092E0A60|nr:acyl-CoA thioesterase [Proteiniborus sp. DW1]SCG84433.1 Cytosolic acyl coenzyme A thioester hydrolase [Proteiniborus sp. DW1]